MHGLRRDIPADGVSEEKRVELIDTSALRQTGRVVPVFFGGRTDETARLEECMRRVENGDQGALTVISGIPGAGKTALATRFCDEVRDSGEACVLHADEALLRSPTHLAHRIRVAQEALGVDETPPMRRVFERLATPQRVRVGTRGTHVQWTAAENGVPAEDDVRGFPSALLAVGAKPGVPVVLVVDEAHRIALAKCACLHDIHAGRCAVPILPLLIGMRSIYDRLEDASLQRIDSGKNLALRPIAIEDANECVRETALVFGVARGHATSLGDALAPTTGGFAAHVDAAISGIAGTMREHGHTLPPTAWRQCVERAAVARKDYYERRIRATRFVPRAFLRVLAEAVVDPDTGEERLPAVDGRYVVAVSDVLKRGGETIKEWKKAYPQATRRLTFETAMRAANDAGVLEHDITDDTFVFPAAPSMACHLLGIEDPALRRVEGSF